MKEVHKMYIEVLEEEIEKAESEQGNLDGDMERWNIEDAYIKGLQFALDKAKGILPL